MAKQGNKNRLAMNRRRFIAYFSSIGLGASLLPGTLTAVAQESDAITVEMIEAAEKLAGLSFSKENRERMVRDLERLRTNYQNIREMNLDQSVAPCFIFNPIPPGFEEIEPERKPVVTSSVDVSIPRTDKEIAFLPVTHLSILVKSRQVTSTELTKLYIARLKKYDTVLKCVVTFTEELALKQAKQADEEIAAGNYRGPLHGIPWGLKDLASVQGYKTTWGAEPFKDQKIDTDATVYKRLTDAGAVLVAKLSTGALAAGNSRWFGGETKNPWNTGQSASGSSAGSAAATAAGLVGFSIGTETMGSIISPSSRCGATGLRPTFGRVSRYSVMPLSWTMDKVGPICRTAEDCAVVLNAIYGPDGFDMSVIDKPFDWHPAVDVRKIRVGYLKAAFERASTASSEEGRRRAQERNALNEEALNILRTLGIELIPIELPGTLASSNIGYVLHTESAAAFDEITRSGEIDLVPNNRPHTFRVRRFVPAVEYINAMRVRTILMQELNKSLKDVDFYVAPGGSTGFTNHTGHPALTLPHGFINGLPSSINFIGTLFSEAEMLVVARAFQNATDHHLKHPNL